MMGDPVIVKTTRFGQIAVNESDILHFGEGLLGFAELRKFILLDDPNDDIFAWLQSCENPAVAFPVLEPELFAASFKVSLAKSDLEGLKANASTALRTFSIITIPDDPTLMTANLKAPIVINVASRIARQCVLQDNSLAIREPIFAKLQQRVVQNPEASIKQQSTSIEVTVKINPTASTPDRTL
jgi:flagellar assembly factor FliW